MEQRRLTLGSPWSLCHQPACGMVQPGLVPYLLQKLLRESWHQLLFHGVENCCVSLSFLLHAAALGRTVHGAQGPVFGGATSSPQEQGQLFLRQCGPGQAQQRLLGPSPAGREESRLHSSSWPGETTCSLVLRVTRLCWYQGTRAGM